MSIWGKREVVIGVWAVVGMLSVYQVVIFYLQYQTQIQCQSLCIITSITYRDQTNDCWWEMRKERREVNNSILKNCFLRLELEEVYLPSHLSYVSSMRCNDWFCFLSAVLLVIFGLYEWVYTTQQIITGESEEPCQHTAWSPGHNQAVLTTLVISTSPSPLPPPQTLQLWATSSKIIYLAGSPPHPAQPVTCRPGWMLCIGNFSCSW